MQSRRCDPSWGTTKGTEQKIVREFGHGDLSVLCLVIQNADEEPADVRRIMTWSCHGVSCLSVALNREGGNAIILLYPNPDVLRRGAIGTQPR